MSHCLGFKFQLSSFQTFVALVSLGLGFLISTAGPIVLAVFGSDNDVMGHSM